ncbi:MAG: orotate phosphoribosyltransferase [Chloroflexi bacterium RBG_13_53_26]|jgi:orotate phosphoribosyltransferase|nr:MAG: orotate phosphoribosyltransferase [Chloroflexi bacterium RBG_13_53_26]
MGAVAQLCGSSGIGFRKTLESEAERIFKEAGAFAEGHFQLTSGLHSPIYWEKFRILEQPRYTERLCRMIAEHFRGHNIQLVAGPTTGGVIVAYEVAKQLGVRSIYAERQGNARVFRRGFEIAQGEQVLVVDDVLTTGGSVREVIAEVKRRGGRLVGLGVLVDRSQGEMDFGTPLFSCLRTVVPTYKPEECPLCGEGKPLVKPGSGESPSA